ncbi:MerR family transcriptional regulator [Novosphingobium sp. CECT 9465]|uniref:MerR family transcriptional regulator n=1 Tax=Novosphingobium sp. CECT 9465 TaxID=2829794 RepID=UPI001E2BF074|nr:MerR family transcriptional regulator [Novosphingobium sp. CECT 9465]CAH0496391.1 hypothetical protein NVSP9465_01424 [Novosphingobium sp. CECT 9465]
MDTSLYPRDLFTRVQIARMTGIDDSTLNYWMREGLLRAAEGGTGRGSHRRFEYREVSLAALLQQLRGFGIGTPSLAAIARRFHEAVDWMETNGISQANLYVIWDLLRIQKEFVREGRIARHVSGQEDELWFAEFEKYRKGLVTWVELTWEQALAYDFRPRPNRGAQPQPSAKEVALVRSWTSEADFQFYAQMERYWEAISHISFEEPKDPQGDGTFFFRMDEAGEWHLSEEIRSRCPGVGVSFIGIDMAMLTYRLWSGWAEASGSALAAKNRSRRWTQ